MYLHLKPSWCCWDVKTCYHSQASANIKSTWSCHLSRTILMSDRRLREYWQDVVDLSFVLDFRQILGNDHFNIWPDGIAAHIFVLVPSLWISNAHTNAGFFRHWNTPLKEFTNSWASIAFLYVFALVSNTLRTNFTARPSLPSTHTWSTHCIRKRLHIT